MKYVNNEGPITSVNECPQPGKCERVVDDNDPELVAFLERVLSMRPVEVKIDTDSQPLLQK